MGIEAAIIGGALTAAGGIASSAMTNSANKKIASAANDTQIELANTAHQREVADLKAAGLNPILSAGGNGAAVPTMHTPQVDYGIGDAMSKGITNYSAMQSAKQFDPLVDQLKSQKALNDALASKAEAEKASALSVSRSVDMDSLLKAEDLKIKKSGATGRLFGSEVGDIFQRAVTPHLSSAVDTTDRSLREIIDSVYQSSARTVDTYRNHGLRGGFLRSKLYNDYLKPSLNYFTK